MSPRARQAKGKARLNAYEELLAQDTQQKIERVRKGSTNRFLTFFSDIVDEDLRSLETQI